MSKEAMKLALGKIKSARDCHPNAVDTLLFEAEEILETALAEQPAQPQQELAEAYRTELDKLSQRNYELRFENASLKAQQQEPVTVLPDGSAFAVMSYPLPKDHWLYADRQYNDGEYEPVELGKPVLTHELRDAVVSAVRYAIRGATNCGKEVDFDPDALVRNAVYALCGPFTSPPAQRKPLTDDEIQECWYKTQGDAELFARAIEAKLKEKNT